MYIRTCGLWLWFSMFLMLHAPVEAALVDKFNPADYIQPKECPPHYDFVESDGKCKIKTTLNKSDCESSGAKFTGATCESSAAGPPPTCKSIPGYDSNINDAKCSFERTIPVSGAGDYISDCFEINVVPKDATDLTAGKNYLVTNQRAIDTTDTADRELSLVSSTNFWHSDWDTWPLVGCTAEKNGTQHHVSASKLIVAGAKRRGYAYGFLTMPYKYFRSKKSFLINVPLGGYLGLRYGQAGSGTTFAFAVTLSSVKAETIDPAKLDAAGKPTITGTADVSALSGAFGFIFDVLKSQAGKPFKAGIFVGRDVVNSTPTIDYQFNRKTWIAIQLGYDFTDG